MLFPYDLRVPLDVPAPTHVLTLVFVAWATGTIFFGAVSQQWSEIGPGHFKVVWLVSIGLAAAAGFGYHPAWIVAGLSLVTFGAIYRKLDRPLAVVTAVVAVVLVIVGEPIYTLALAALLGAVTNAMLLGHWHLNQPRLGTKPIARLVYLLWGSLVVTVAATALLLGVARGVGVLGAVTAIAFTSFAAVLTGMVHHLVRTRSIMSATGILYLEILLCFVAAFTGSLAALAPR
jgi:hypothetical protein